MVTPLLLIALSGLQVSSGSQDPAQNSMPNILCTRWKNVGALTVKSTSFTNGGMIPNRFSSYGDNYSPQLSWSGLPAGTMSVAIVAEDPDAMMDEVPMLHWFVTDLPATMMELGEQAASTDMKPTWSQGGVQGKGGSGSIGYFGMRPSELDKTHHYYFSVFALDKKLDLPEGFDRKQAVDAMEGHVLACGHIMGTYTRTR